MRALALVLAPFALAPAAAAQVFASAPTQIPATGSFTQEVDFGDVDLDGDWDAALADGGDAGNDQNRLYVNQGGLQGGATGFYLDETAARLPIVADDSFDIDFADIDSDGDLDLHSSNTSDISNQANRWWINKGGLQGGTLGYYQDETASRWIGLGLPGSSIPPAMLLPSGGFLDWTYDSDFADLDGDGDLDLVHSSAGGVFSGSVPSRVFLNNGSGFFGEFNPSGFTPVGMGLVNGDPGLWAEGVQQNGTIDTTGAFCDITNTPLDIELGDIDADLDIDLLMGSRNSTPRMFQNRLVENGGTLLSMRDVTGSPGTGSFPLGAISGSDNYEQEMGDMDADGDLDVIGVNWPALNDVALNNPGNGKYDTFQTLTSSGGDDNSADFLDYDADGDLDLVIAAFIGANKLYRNDYAGGGPGTFSYSFVSAAASGFTSSHSLDADTADVDADGDQDVMSAEDSNHHEILWLNLTGVPDTSAPRVPTVSGVGGGPAATGGYVVRAQVYDNSAYYATWYVETAIELSVDGVALPPIPMKSSGGQIFRGVIPKNLVGVVSWRVVATDEHGNTGASLPQVYLASGGPAGSAFGAGSLGSLGVPSLTAQSIPFGGTSLYLAGGNAPAGALSFLALSATSMPPLDLGNGLIANLGFPLIYLQQKLTDPAGHAVHTIGVPGGLSGHTVRAQFVTIDGVGGNLFASSQGLAAPLP